MQVKIIEDVRKDGKAAGQIGKFSGCRGEAWILFDENGSPAKESHSLPEGYLEWNPDKEKFPGAKCGVRGKNPVFRLDDGSEILGSQCFWEPTDLKLKKKIAAEAKTLFRRAKEN
jgi:hypothetical protein